MASALGPGAALAVPDCETLPEAKVIASDQGRLESIIADAFGRLYFTDLTDNRLLRIEGPGAEPKVLTEDIARPGGLAWDPDGSLITGVNGGAQSGIPGSGGAGILKIDPETGAKQDFVAGLDQANGMARGPDGTYYTSNNIGGEIVRVTPDGMFSEFVQSESPNGLAVDSTGEYLFAAETFRPAKVLRFSLADPSQVDVWFEATGGDMPAGPDGLTRDAADRVFVAANSAGEVWRIDRQGEACAIARGMGLVSNVAFGGGGAGFPERNLYAVNFGGDVIELADATDRPPEPGGPGSVVTQPLIALKLTVRPRVVEVGERRRFRFRVTAAGEPVRGARVSLGDKRTKTGRRGRARLKLRFKRAGRRTARASRAGYRGARRDVRVRRG